MQTLKNNQNKINNKLADITQIKYDIESILSKKFDKNNISFKLTNNRDDFNKFFGTPGLYIPNFLRQIWENPKSISTILLKAETCEEKKCLASFFVNGLYDNISSLHQKDEQLIYIITLLLKEEINSLKNGNDIFLDDNSSASIMLKEFRKRKEVKFYFKKILFDIFELLENKYSSEDIIFDTHQIRKSIQISDFVTIKEKLKKNNNDNNIELLEYFNDIYVYQPLNKEKLLEKIEIHKDEAMRKYLQKIKEECEDSPEKYSNQVFLGEIVSSDKFESIMNSYKKSFFQVVEIIDLLFANLLINIDVCPYYLKCFGKIISVLIKKKFPTMIKIEQNKFLVHFFFQNFLFPILINPSLNSFMNEFIISQSTIRKLAKISSILSKLLKGNLYENNSYTPFNWYIIDKMPNVFNFFNNICQVSLPSFIDKILNDELPENYEYEYFKENPRENILYRNICFNAKELYTLVSCSQKCKNEINIDEKLISKLQSNLKKLENLAKKEEYEEIQKENARNFSIIEKRKVIKYFALTDLINNKKLDKLLKIKKENHFSLKELKQIEKVEERVENNIIKVKNFFFALLYNHQMLSKNEYNEENLYDIVNILKELSAHSRLNSSIFADSKYIPLNWHLNSLLHYLPTLPDSYRENDYKKLLNEIETEITNSIKFLDFEKLTIFIDYYKEAEKEEKINEKIKYILNDIELNKIVEEIIENEKICLDFNEDNKQTHFFKDLMKNNKEFTDLFTKSQSQRNYKQNKENKMNNNIDYFIKKIPDIDKYRLNEDFNHFRILEESKIPDIIENYIELIKKNLKNKNFGNEIILDDIYNKLYDYIMEQLYDKLFPEDPLKEDINIFKNCYKHQWVELQNLVKKNKNYIFDDYLPDSINYFQQFEKEKSPRKKLLCLQEIYNCIYNLAKFNSDELEGADDEIPLLSYSLIQSKSQRIYSNSKYVELFLGKKAIGREGSQLTKILGICEKMEKASYKDFYNITEFDYNLKCDLVTKTY